MLSNSLKTIIYLASICHMLTLIRGSSDIKVSCKNENADNVDWFYLYKLPAHYDSHKNSSFQPDTLGLNYMYLTNTSHTEWILSKRRINESNSMAAITLDHLFKDPLVLLLAYNDEFPDGEVKITGGHTKGVIATDGRTAIWLIHSVPKFPSIPKYEYPKTGSHYGQSFLCITLNATEMEKIGLQLLFNEPNIYYQRVPVALSGKYPYVEQAIEKQWIKSEPFNNVVDLTTLQGITFKSFAKSGNYHKELYEDLVAPILDTNLMVETWRNGAGNLQSNCTLNDYVYNIEALHLENPHLDFNTSQDHSKWAVSQSVGLQFWRWRIPSTSNWICVGDINRQQHQLQRGGGCLCQRHKMVAKLYRNLIKQYETCHKKKEHKE